MIKARLFAAGLFRLHRRAGLCVEHRKMFVAQCGAFRAARDQQY